MTVNLNLPPYLAQYCAEKYNAQDNIIDPVKGSPISQFLRVFLRHKNTRPQNPKENTPADPYSVTMKIRIPHFPGRDPQYYNYLSPIAESQLRDLIRSIFEVELFSDFTKISNFNIPVNEYIYSWMDAHGIEPEEKNWLAISKRLQLLRMRDRDRTRKAKHKKQQIQ